MAAAGRLHYQPNLAARALASRHSGLVGLVADDLRDGLVMAIVEAAQRSLDRRGYGVLISGSRDGGTSVTIERFLARGVEAVLLAGREPGRAEIEALTARGVPWIAVAESRGDDPCHWDIGRARGAELACRYLLNLGHPRLGVLCDGAGSPRLATSLAGILATITFADAPPGGDAAVTRDAVRRLLDAPARPTAIVCPGDSQALIALRECAMREIRIPEELSVVGFGDEPFARYSHPALTTVRVAMAELGSRSGDALADMLVGGSPERYTAGLKVIVRETTGRGSG